MTTPYEKKNRDRSEVLTETAANLLDKGRPGRDCELVVVAMDGDGGEAIGICSTCSPERLVVALMRVVNVITSRAPEPDA